jgi:hypothetical protein
MALILDGTLGITTPSETNTGTLSVTGVTTLTGGLNAALPVLSGGTGVTTKTGTGAVVLGTSPTLTTPTFDSASLATISGTAPLYMCRAWVAWTDNGTATTTRGSGNVTSITRTATSDNTINFTTAMVDANYSVAGISGYNTTSMTALVIPFNTTPPSTSAIRVQTVSSDGVLRTVGAGAVFFSVSIFR